jgi:uncharacterized protein (TIGR02147 family)
MQSMGKKTVPVIFEYDNYRVFLRDLYTHFKNEKSSFSYRYFSRRAGFTSPNFLKLVIENKRNLSMESIGRFARAFKLTKTETDFFGYLVHFNQAPSDNEKARWAQLILQSKGFQKIHPLRQAEYCYYANWYYIPLREIILLRDFKEDPQWIANQFAPPLSSSQVTNAFEHLSQLKMIERDENGCWRQTQKSITTGNEVYNSSVKQYHLTMIQKGAECIDRVAREKREVSSVCIPVSLEKRDEIKKLIQRFRQEIMVLAEADEGPESIYQLNIQWFPLVEKD